MHRISFSLIILESRSAFLFMSENKNNPRQGGPSWVAGVKLFSEISAWIVVPIIGALILGKKLDTRYHTTPWIFFSLTGFAFLITIFGIVRVVKNYMKKIKNNGK